MASVAKLRVNSEEFEAKIKRAAEGVNALGKSLHDTGKTLLDASEDEVAFVKAMGDMPTVMKSSTQSLRELTRATTDLTIQYRQLTDEEKNSPMGRAMAASIKKMTDRAGEMRDAMGDVQASINHMASDTRIFDQFAGAANLATSGFQTLQGAGKLLGLEMGNNVEVIAKLQAAMAVTNGLTQIQNLLQKESALMQGLNAAKAALSAAAHAVLSKELTAAAVAQEALNVAMKAAPWMLIGSAILGACELLGVFSSDTKEASNRQDGMNKKLSEGASYAQLYANALDDAYDKLIQYQQGIGHNTDYLELEKAQVKAEELQKQFEEMYKKRAGRSIFEAFSNGENLQDWLSTNYHQEDLQKVADMQQAAQKDVDKLKAKIQNAADVTKYFVANWDKLTTRKDRQLAMNVFVKMRDEADEGSYLYKWADERVKALEAKLNKNKPTIKVNTPKIQTEEQQISAQVTTLTKEYQDLATAAKTADDAQKAGITERMTAIKGEIQTLQTRSDELKKFADDAKRIEYPTGSLPQLTQQMKELQEAQSKALNGEQWQKYQQAIEKTQVEIDKLKGKYQIIEGQSIQNSEVLNSFISGIKSDLEKADFGSALYNSLSAQLADMTTLQNLVTQSLKAGLGTALFDVADETGADFWTRAMEGGVENVDWQKIIDKINEELKKKGLDTIGIDFGTGDTKGGGDSKSKYQPKSIADATNTLVSSVSGIFTGIEQLGIELPKGFKDVIGGIQGIMSILTAINTILGVIEGLQAVQSLPFFARGGIVPHAAAGYFVPGNHFSGDTTPIMANAGELILNKSSQNNLASLITEAESRGGASGVARVSGEQIWVALNAYTKRTGKGELVTWR